MSELSVWASFSFSTTRCLEKMARNLWFEAFVSRQLCRTLLSHRSEIHEGKLHARSVGRKPQTFMNQTIHSGFRKQRPCGADTFTKHKTCCLLLRCDIERHALICDAYLSTSIDVVGLIKALVWRSDLVLCFCCLTIPVSNLRVDWCSDI